MGIWGSYYNIPEAMFYLLEGNIWLAFPAVSALKATKTAQNNRFRVQGLRLRV